MKYKKRSIGFTLAILCTFTLLLAACRGTPFSQQTTSQKNAKLNLRETATAMPGATGSATVGSGQGAYVGQMPSDNTWIGLSSSGSQIVAFVTDGSQGHSPTFAQWFKGPVTNGTVDTTATGKNGSDRLQATLSGDTASGTVTMAGGKAIPFTANAVPSSDQTSGLYRSTQTINGQSYVAGWIVVPQGAANGTATPTGTGTAVPPTGTATTPSATETVAPGTTGTAAPGAPGTATPSTGTATPGATGTVTPSTGALQQGGAIVNEQTHNILPVPELSPDDINAKQVNVPNLATFKLAQCRQNLC